MAISGGIRLSRYARSHLRRIAQRPYEIGSPESRRPHPGAAWLEWWIEPLRDGGSRLVQTASFAPRGLAGALYWYGLYPIHRPIFSDLVAAIGHRAEDTEARSAA